MTLNINQTVREIVTDRPETSRVFEELGIDYCCGGNRSLAEACEKVGVSTDHLLEKLAATGEQSAEKENWSNMDELARHIVQKHHAYIRSESPRMEGLLEKVVSRHGQAHPEVLKIRELFQALAQELNVHMFKEEHILFPYLAKMEAAARTGRPVPPECFDSVQRPISRMLADHDDAGELLSNIRSHSGGYRPPQDACPTYRALYGGLEEFERDLHRHIHLENNILFPQAIALEARMADHAHA